MTVPCDARSVLTARASRVREWAVFTAVALVPAVATGALALRALRNEEAAIRREVALAASAEAAKVAARIETELAAALEAVPASLDAERDPVARVHALAPAFAAPLVLEGGRPLGSRVEAPAPADPACREVGARLATARGRERDELLASVLGPCREARSAGGRWLYPVVAFEKGAPVAAWLGEHASRMTVAERSLAELDVESSALPADEKTRARAALAGASFAELPALLREPEAVTALGRPAEGSVAWKSASAAARLVTRGDRRVGFIVHQGSLESAMARGWPPLPPDLVATVARGAAREPRLAESGRAQVAGELWLLVSPRDPGMVARRTSRSRAVLAVVGALATALAFGVAAVLFARERAARRSSALRTDFVSAVSHELRTPIASIRMLAELLEEKRVEPGEEREVHEALANEARRLGATVDRLLGFGRLEAGRHAVALTEGPLDASVEASIAVFEARHPDCTVDRALAPVVVPHDPELVRLAVDNLLENARKYAPEGGPYRVSVTRVTGSPAGARVTVSDRGPGIARKHQKRIFEPFERADDRLSRATEGTGIGLALVRHVARVHGGVASVESDEGKGASFSFSIAKETS